VSVSIQKPRRSHHQLLVIDHLHVFDPRLPCFTLLDLHARLSTVIYTPLLLSCTIIIFNNLLHSHPLRLVSPQHTFCHPLPTTTPQWQWQSTTVNNRS
jgi:hypothetical protein